MKSKYNLIAIALVLTAAFAFTASVSAQAISGSYWYNGDANGVNGLANERNTIVSDAAVYDDFNVGGSGITVTGVYSRDLVTTGFAINGADWEIRANVSAGNGGTLVASGFSQNPIFTPTGRTFFNLPEYTVEVLGLNVSLNANTRYWLMVRPVDSGSGRSFNSTTSGANCVGSPCGNDGTSFFNSTFFGANFSPTSTQLGFDADFSDGVIVPEPSTVALVACGLGALVVAIRRRRA
jgi:PEP-CTERM motif-containing protein